MRARSEWTDWAGTAPMQEDARALREWRWRCYTDHLRDLGYELNGGQPPSDEPESWVPLRRPAGTGETSADAR